MRAPTRQESLGMVRKASVKLGLIAVIGVVATNSACTLIADIDRREIKEGSPSPSGTQPDSGPTMSTAPMPSAPDAAAPDAAPPGDAAAADAATADGGPLTDGSAPT